MTSDTSKAFTECDTLLEHSEPPPLRQGDVFEWLGPSRDCWQRWGIVVTANCDFANEKHGGIVSYVPVISVRDYARLFMLPQSLRKVMKRHRDEVVAHVRRFQSAHSASFSTPLSEDAIFDWIENCELNDLLDQLGAPNGRDRERATVAITKYKIGSAAILDGGFEVLLEAVLHLREGKQERFREELAQQMRTLPGDAFFLGDIGSGDSSGCIAYLRLVRELRIGQVAIRQADLRDSQVLARRLSRIRAPYVYRLTQQLAEVFASIGLPREYELNRESLATSAFLPAGPSEMSAVNAKGEK